MKRVERIDRIPIRLDESSIERDGRGYARVWGSVVPVNALLTYGRADGYDSDEHVEFVPEETVSDPDAIATLLFSPITMPHPPEMLDASNTARFQIGTVIDAKVEDGELRALHQFTDATALDRVAGGMVELSPGYTAEIDETPGTFEGQPYAAVQRNRRYNHQAVVDQARAGAGNRLIIDSARVTSGLRIQVRRDEETPMAKIVIDEKEFEVADEVASEMARLQEAASSKDQEGEEEEEMSGDAEPAADSEGSPAPVAAGSESTPPPTPSTPEAIAGKSDSLSKLFARIDGLEDRVASRIEAKAKARKDAAEKARREAEEVYSDAKSALPKAYSTDGKSAAQIMRDAIVARNPDLKAKADAAIDKPERLRGMFDVEMASAPKQDSHPLGDNVPDGQTKDPWRKRVDAARKVHRTHRVLGTEAMRHADVVSAAAN